MNVIFNCVGRGFESKIEGLGKDFVLGGFGVGYGILGGDGKDVSGGEEVGFVYELVFFGVRGGMRIGRIIGSRGGGCVCVSVGFVFWLDGIINVDGDDVVMNLG